MLTKQANDSWRACFTPRTPPRSAGIKGEHVQTHISFLLQSRAFSANLRECLQTATVLVLRRVSGGCDPVLLLLLRRSAAFQLRSRRDLPCALQHFSKRAFFFLKRANYKRAPRATGVFLKMASRSCVSGCGRFLASSDGHDRCVSCLGFQHAETALVDDSCSLCGNMTIAMLRSRYLLVKRGGIPLAMPRSSSSGSRKCMRR